MRKNPMKRMILGLAVGVLFFAACDSGNHITVDIDNAAHSATGGASASVTPTPTRTPTPTPTATPLLVEPTPTATPTSGRPVVL